MRTADFDYELPPALIAQTPPPRRSDARLLVLRRETGAVEHRAIADLPDLLSPGDLVVVNDTRVLPARLRTVRASGGRVELLLLHPVPAPAAGSAPAVDWVALARPARRLRAGECLRAAVPERGPAAAAPPGDVGDGWSGGAAAPSVPGGAAPEPAEIRVLELLGEGRVAVRLPLTGPAEVPAFLARHGEVPLPPYIHQRLDDPERYQTVYARTAGSAAAPTAGLHFTPELLAALEARGIGRAALTLHVGLGTFRPVAADDPRDHRLHAEWCELGPGAAGAVGAARARGGRVVAVGTTAVRTLESRAAPDGAVRPGSGWTDLYILPGRRFQVVDALLTNLHLPRSTLLMLVAAFAGREPVMAAYREAVRLGYRFFSFGDAMLIL